jgi:hypothetical protein
MLKPILERMDEKNVIKRDPQRLYVVLGIFYLEDIVPSLVRARVI